MAEDCELWDIICDGPYVPTKVLEELPFSMAKTSKEYTDADKKAMQKNFRAKKILVCGIGPEEYNRISTCDTATEIWEALKTVHEGTTQVKQTKIDMLTTEYELFKMRDDESIQDMHSRFTFIINELHSLEELIGNLKTYELKRKIDSERREPKREKNRVLKANNNDSSEEDSDMSYLTKRFQKMVRINGEMLKRDKSNRPKTCDLCYRCGNPGHFMKDCPLLKQEFSKNYHDKTDKTNPVPFKDFKRKRSADNIMRQALAAWGDSSSESEDEPDTGDSFMMAVKGEETEYDSTFALIAQSDGDEDNGNKEKDLVHGLPMSQFKMQKVCDAYARGKHVKSSFKSKKDVSTSKALELLHMDLCGPKRVQSRGGKRCIFVIVDDYSRFTWTLFLKTKDEIVEVITHNFSAPRTPQQNGVVERKNKTLEEIARTMLINSGITKNFWAEAINTACYLVNRKPKVTHLRTFGCKCYVLNNGKDQLGKFDAKSDEVIFLGYSSQSKAYKIYNKRTQCIEESVHVIFDESYPSCEKSAEEDQDGELLLVPGEVINITNGKADMMSQVKDLNEDNTTSSSIEPSTLITTTKAEERVVDAVQGTPLAPERRIEENQPSIPSFSQNEPRVSNWRHQSSYPIENIITPLDFEVQTRSRAINSLAFSAFLSQIEPKNIKEALKDVDWITAIQDELHQFERNNV
ncbi:uncharacterized protein [Nicotiana sylvestris]|uniref:uncharacterized protein n=1 Tax=Nicotiana sylvestris TaxID=4096 RepID=UPI00388C6249